MDEQLPRYLNPRWWRIHDDDDQMYVSDDDCPEPWKVKTWTLVYPVDEWPDVIE